MQGRSIIGIIVLALFIGGGFFFYQKGSASVSQAKGRLESMGILTADRTSQLQNLSQDASKQLEVFGSRTANVTQHLQQVLGAQIQVNEEGDKPLHEKALEYGTYLYCKQVVESYEKTATPSGTTTPN